MRSVKLINLNIFLISAIVICFEIISTRISSVIFVQNYAFIIISLSLLGLSIGGVFSFYKYKINNEPVNGLLFIYHVFAGLSTAVFIAIIVLFQITNEYLFFVLIIIPFFFLGIISSLLFRIASATSYLAYSASLAGSAVGAFISLTIFYVFTASNFILFIAVCTTLLSFIWYDKNKNYFALVGLGILILLVGLGKNSFLGEVPIGMFPEKDIYNTYDDSSIRSNIIESKWGINGRADFVEYDNQDVVKHLFIDGAAGSHMFKFDGNIANHDTLLNRLLLEFSTSTPFLLMNEKEKEKMLVIGPGGGKDVLIGLLSGVKNITGVEVNPQFVEIVKKYKDYNGGIYSNFGNVKIVVGEGRHFVKQAKEKWNVLLMALPSTEQLQSIDNLASNENFLLTKEAVIDYLNTLTDDGRIIYTVHDRNELLRLIVTTLEAFKKEGFENKDAINHFMILGADYAPTLVVKKRAFTQQEVLGIIAKVNKFPQFIPQITFLPYTWDMVGNSIENNFLKQISLENKSAEELIKSNNYDISSVADDKPYFYKINFGIPEEFLKLFLILLLFAGLVVLLPYKYSKAVKSFQKEKNNLVISLIVFVCTGIGFMIMEVSLFQKLILYLGYPTVSLSILLVSLLVGMGIGSFNGNRIFPGNPHKRLVFATAGIVVCGILFFMLLQYLLNLVLPFGTIYCFMVCFVTIIPFGVLVGIPFPTALQILNDCKMEKFIPWMYGISGIMGVLGSVVAIIVSMLFGYTTTFVLGISFYVLISSSVYLVAKKMA